MTTYTFYACDLRTGEVLGELPITSFSGTRHLEGGSMTAELYLGDTSLAAALEILNLCRTGCRSIAVDRDGVLVGEWVIWKRSRANDPLSTVKLAGDELVSYLDRRLCYGHDYLGVDQIYFAKYLTWQACYEYTVHSGPIGSADLSGPPFTNGPEGDNFVGGSPVSFEFANTALSGVIIDRRVLRADQSAGVIIRELSKNSNGFDYTFEPQWQLIGGVRYVKRVFWTYYPRAGAELSLTLSSAQLNGTGSVLSVQIDEDGTVLADRVHALGATDTVGRLIRFSSDAGGHFPLVLNGYPMLQTNISVTEIDNPDTLIARADGELAHHRTDVLPPTVTVLADGTPPFGSYQLGDRVTVDVDPSVNFPSGYTGRLRILGWTINPPNAGPETIALTMARDD